MVESRKEHGMKVQITSTSVRFEDSYYNFPSYIAKIKKLGYDVEKKYDYYARCEKFYIDVELSDLVKIASALNQEGILVCAKYQDQDFPLIEIYDTYRE